MDPSKFSDNDQALFQFEVLPFRPYGSFHVAVFGAVAAHTSVQAIFLAFIWLKASQKPTRQNRQWLGLEVFHCNLLTLNICSGARMYCKSCR